MNIIENRYKIGREHFFIGEMKLSHWKTKCLVVDEKEDFYIVENKGSDDVYTLEIYKSSKENELSLNSPVYLSMNDIGAIRFTVYSLQDDEVGMRSALDMIKEKIINNLEKEREDIEAKIRIAKKL